MSSFQTFIKGHSSDKKQFWFIHGSEAALVEDCLDIAKTHISANVDNVCMSVYFGDAVTEEEILRSFEMDFWEERHIILLYDVDKFKEFKQLCGKVDKINPSVFLIAVSSQPSIDLTDDEFSLFKGTKGRNITCNVLNEEGLGRWIGSRVNITTEAKNRLIERSKGDYEWILNQLRKLELLPTSSISIKEVDRICTDFGTPDFSESLLKYDKRSAILAVRGEETPNVSIPHLFNTVRKAGLLNMTIQNLGLFVRPITEKTGLPQKEIAELKNISAYYNATTVARCLRVLKPYSVSSQPTRTQLLAMVAGW